MAELVAVVTGAAAHHGRAGVPWTAAHDAKRVPSLSGADGGRRQAWRRWTRAAKRAEMVLAPLAMDARGGGVVGALVPGGLGDDLVLAPTRPAEPSPGGEADPYEGPRGEHNAVIKCRTGRLGGGLHMSSD